MERIGYERMYNLVKSLGWRHSGSWANREFYSIGKFTIVEHNNDWTIEKDDDLYFIDIDGEDMLREYTAIVTDITGNLNNPDCTLGEFKKNLHRLNDFYHKHQCGEEVDFGFLE